MKNKSITHNRYPTDRKHFISNLAISLWFPGAKAEIDKTGSAKRKSQWAKLNPWNMKVEPPVVFKADNFVSCIVDRKAGILLKDKEVPLITFDTFLEKSNPSLNGDPSEVKPNLKLDELYALVQNPDGLSASPVFYLANIDGSKDYTVVFDSKSEVASLDKLVSCVFRDYDFESIVISALDKTDEEASKLAPVAGSIDSFYTGTVSVADKVLKEKSLTFKLIDLNLLASVVTAAKKSKASVKQAARVEEETTAAQTARANKGKNASRDELL